jgi:hypothetical protein
MSVIAFGLKNSSGYLGSDSPTYSIATKIPENGRDAFTAFWRSRIAFRAIAAARSKSVCEEFPFASVAILSSLALSQRLGVGGDY